jgi:hypothetical protein
MTIRLIEQNFYVGPLELGSHLLAVTLKDKSNHSHLASRDSIGGERRDDDLVEVDVLQDAHLVKKADVQNLVVGQGRLWKLHFTSEDSYAVMKTHIWNHKTAV